MGIAGPIIIYDFCLTEYCKELARQYAKNKEKSAGSIIVGLPGRAAPFR